MTNISDLSIINQVEELLGRKDLDWHLIKTTYGNIYLNNVRGFYIEAEDDIIKIYIGYSLVMIVDVKDLSNQFHLRLHKINLSTHEDSLKEFLSL